MCQGNVSLLNYPRHKRLFCLLHNLLRIQFTPRRVYKDYAINSALDALFVYFFTRQADSSDTPHKLVAHGQNPIGPAISKNSMDWTRGSPLVSVVVSCLWLYCMRSRTSEIQGTVESKGSMQKFSRFWWNNNKKMSHKRTIDQLCTGYFNLGQVIVVLCCCARSFQHVEQCIVPSLN